MFARQIFYSDLSSISCDRKLGNLCLYCICHCLRLVSLENWSPVPPVFITTLFTHRKAAIIWETISDLRLKPKKVYSLRNVSPSLGLFDYFPGCGILNYRSDRDWLLRVCFWGCSVTLLKIALVSTMSTPITAPMISPKIGLLP